MDNVRVRLFAALVPPPDVLARTRALVESIAPPGGPTESAGQVSRRRARRRWFRRRNRTPAPLRPMIDLLPPASMYSPIAAFGNLSLEDATQLANEMDRQASSWETPRLRLTGGVALEPEGDSSLWVRLDGDVDELWAVTRGVTHAANALHLFVDRRVFRPVVQIGSITQHATPDYLESVLAALEEFESNAWWQTTVTLLVPTEGTQGQAGVRTFRDIPLGPAVEH